jgi:hypothetical protein
MATKLPKYDPNLAALAEKQPLSSILTGTTASFTEALEAKLSGIAPGANLSASEALTSGFIVLGDSGNSVIPSTIEVTGGNNLSLGSVDASELNIDAINWGTTVVPKEHGGTGVDNDHTITTTANAVIGGTNSGDQNVFSSVAVSGQTTVASASTTGTLTIAAGEGVTITTDNSTKTITLTAEASLGIPVGGLLAWPTSDLASKPDGFLEADGTEGTDDISADNTAAITWLQRADGVAPELVSATIGADGETVTLVFTEAVTGTGTSGGGFTLASDTLEAVTIGALSGSGTDTLTGTASRVILDALQETLTISYTPGDYEDSIGLPLEAFSTVSVVNNSEEEGIGFVPSDLPSLKIWLKPESLTGSNGDPVATWADSSVNAYDATGTDGYRPSLVVGAINGRNAIQFERNGGTGGVSEHMFFSQDGAKDIFRNVGGGTVFIVYKRTIDSGLGGAIIFRASTAVSSGQGRFSVSHSSSPSTNHDFSARRLDGDSLGISSNAATPALNTWKVMAFQQRYDTTGGAYSWENGTARVADDTVTTSGGNTSNTRSLFVGFGGQGGASDGFTGQYAELLVFNDDLSDSDRNLVEAYLIEKHAL